MDAIVTAGGIPRPEDPLYTYSHGDSKALIDMAGKPMIQWVLDALSGAKNVDNVIIVGLSPRSGVTCKKPTYFVSNQGRMLANIVVGVHKALELNKKSEYVLLVSSDIPTLKPAMVDWLVDTCMETQDDLYYGICPRAVMEKRFPNSKRTYTKLKDIELCGSDINVIHVRMATEHLDLWEALIGSRKNAVRQASMVGWDTAFQLATRSIALDDLVEKACRRIGVKGRVVVWDHAEPCMDVDKPHQLELLRADLAKQQRRSALKAKSMVKKPARKPVKSKPARKPVKSKPARKPVKSKPAARPVKKGSRGTKKASAPATRTKRRAGK
ncbi:MAG: NTP transferase domain-containing protein [Anaerolineales bacterium]|nr:NTP transferase domain-containing protein [Anaerolineales bacterium]